MKPQPIRLGYAVGSGAEVDIPLKHMVVTGQTQEAGKTTALEALITRSGLRALTFITKRGEGAFSESTRLDPYFREQADWQFVASILEASRGEKLKFERAWIIRASKGAKTLADVQKNVRKAMDSAKGMSADVYLTLDAYLEAVVPQIAQVKWATSIKLQPGVNSMDLTGLNVEMQHLVIKSTIDWVLHKEEKTVVVIPEAWKFIPQGRGTPVKLSAEAYIRQAAGLFNFLWLDSQDIAGVDKIILKSIPLWLLGVQREANEIKRTLDNIPDSVSKPKKNDIATLELGQFYACWGRNTIKTYAQPRWMTDARAQFIAASNTCPGAGDHPPTRKKEPTVTTQEAEQLRDENLRLKTMIAELENRLKLVSGAAPVPSSLEPPRPLPSSVTSRPVDRTPVPHFAGEMDTESLYQHFRSRLLNELPSIANGLTLTVTSPEKLRKDFQTAEVNRIIESVKSLKSLPRQILKLLESTDGEFLTGTMIANRLGRAASGGSWTDQGKAIKELVALGFVESVERQGTRKALRACIATSLDLYKPTPTEVEAVYQTVLHHIATAGD